MHGWNKLKVIEIMKEHFKYIKYKSINKAILIYKRPPNDMLNLRGHKCMAFSHGRTINHACVQCIALNIRQNKFQILKIINVFKLFEIHFKTQQM